MLRNLGRGLAPVLRVGGVQSLLLADHVPSCVFDLDVTFAASYAGAGDWKNLCPAPADGAAQGAYDFTMRGTPTWHGTAGAPDCYLRTTGDGGLRMNNTPFINRLQRTDVPGQAYSGFVAFRYVANGAQQGLLNTTGNNVTAGISLRILDTDRLHFRQNSGSSGVSSIMGAEYALTSGQDYVLGFSKRSAGDEFCFWMQGAEVPMANASVACTLDSESATMGLFASASGNGWPMPEGARLYAASMFHDYLSAGDVQKIMGIYRARHKRAYA